MKSHFLSVVFFMLLSLPVFAAKSADVAQADTNTVIKINKQGFDMRMTNPEQTVAYGQRALELAQKLDYKEGIGESYRVIGVGNYYLNESKKSIDAYLNAIDNFKEVNDLRGEGQVYNNIGNLYRLNDYDFALEYFQKALSIAQRLSDTKLRAKTYLNIGDVYFRKKFFSQALNFDNQSYMLFSKLKDTVNLVLCLQNKGVIYFNLHQFDKADSLLNAANAEAKKLDLLETVASVDLTLASSYFGQDKFNDAQKTIEEGLVFAGLVKDEKLESDFKYTSYQLEMKRKNYESAVTYLYEIYHKDSTAFKENSSTQLNLILEQVKQQARQKENEILKQRQAYDRVKFWAVAIVAGLLLFSVGLLISNVRRKSRTNLKLTNLNSEVSRQKDNLDRINHHLEEIIDERTKDLQIKNKKLSEYSSYLSHQIRGPIATLKGLLNLEREQLVDERECIRMMNKSVGEIDDKIIEMSDMLHDPGRAGF
jgi:tetratricopeptide (TPR) repeat protein